MKHKPAQIKALVLAGDGLNCENETQRAFELAGCQADIKHINELLSSPQLLQKYHIFAIPGGFSFGDELSSGQVLALKIKHGLGDELTNFIKAKKPIIGICNGFQTLAKLGLLPAPDKMKSRVMSLAQNNNKHFINRWAVMNNNDDSVCIWTKDLPTKFELPIRHAEGKVSFKGSNTEQAAVYEQLVKKGQIPLYYQNDENGSYKQIAAVCDETGLIFGLMPHPEAAVNQLLYPTQPSKHPSKKGTIQAAIGSLFFENAVNYVRNQLLTNQENTQ